MSIILVCILMTKNNYQLIIGDILCSPIFWLCLCVALFWISFKPIWDKIGEWKDE